MLDPLESKTGKYGVLSLRTPPASPTSTAGGADSAFESSDVLDDEESLDARRSVSATYRAVNLVSRLSRAAVL